MMEILPLNKIPRRVKRAEIEGCDNGYVVRFGNGKKVVCNTTSDLTKEIVAYFAYEPDEDE